MSRSASTPAGRALLAGAALMLLLFGLTGSALAALPTFSVTFTPASPVEATSAGGASVSYTWSSSDSPQPTLVCTVAGNSWSPSTPRTFPLGATTVSCTASNGPPSVGTQTTKTYTITVQDTTPPIISGTPQQIGATATGSSGAVVTWSGLSAVDLVSGSVPVNCTPASGSVFPIGTTPVSCRASDTHGNSSSVDFQVIVSSQSPGSAAPALAVPSLLKVEATSRNGAVVSFSVSSSSSPQPSITCKPASGSLFPFGTSTVRCVAGYTGSSQQTVRTFSVSVRDTTPPAFAATPPNLVKRVQHTTRLRVVYRRPAATDLVDGAVKSVCKPPSGSMFKVGSTTVTCRATDAHGNSSSTSFRVRVLLAHKSGPGLLSPADGTGLTAPPLLTWTPEAGATYYNVQLWSNGNRILSAWPLTSHFRVKRSWTFQGAPHHLGPGTYSWYVWPGFGRLSAAKYGTLIGKRSFTIS